MIWLLFALLAPLLLTMNALVDQFLSRRYAADGGNEIMIFMGGLTYIIIMPALYFLIDQPLLLPWQDIVILILIGAFSTLMWLPYFIALRDSEASLIIPILQLAPIFVFIMGYIFLGETLSLVQAIGSVLLIIGAILLSWHFEGGRFHKKPFFLMLLVSFFVGLQVFLFRIYALDIHWQVILFWNSIGFGGAGLIALFGLSKYRNRAFQLIRETRARILLFTCFQEIAYLTSILLTIMALATAPSAGLVKVVSGVEPLYILLLGIVCARFLPGQFETLGRGKIFIARLAAIIMIAIGLVLVAR